MQEFDASMEERVEEPECLLLEDVVRLTQAKAEVRSYPWYSVRKMAREIVVGTEKKTHLCIECLTEITSKAKRTPNDWLSGTGILNRRIYGEQTSHDN